jgi:hypothetical protein
MPGISFDLWQPLVKPLPPAWTRQCNLLLRSHVINATPLHNNCSWEVDLKMRSWLSGMILDCRLSRLRRHLAAGCRAGSGGAAGYCSASHRSMVGAGLPGAPLGSTTRSSCFLEIQADQSIQSNRCIFMLIYVYNLKI